MLTHYDTTISNECDLSNPTMSSHHESYPPSNVLNGELSITTPFGETPVAGEWW